MHRITLSAPTAVHVHLKAPLLLTKLHAVHVCPQMTSLHTLRLRCNIEGGDLTPLSSLKQLRSLALAADAAAGGRGLRAVLEV